jgi:hypothetical protein
MAAQRRRVSLGKDLKQVAVKQLRRFWHLIVPLNYRTKPRLWHIRRI